MNPNYLLFSVGGLVVLDMLLTFFSYNSSKKEMAELNYVTDRRISKIRSHITSVQTNCRNESMDHLKAIQDLVKRLAELKEKVDRCDYFADNNEQAQCHSAKRITQLEESVDALFKHATFEDVQKSGSKKNKHVHKSESK